MSNSPLIYQRDGARALLTLHRPDRRNALSPELVLALREGLDRARADAGVLVVVLTGSGDKAFCAGGDLGGGMMDGGVVPAHLARAGFADLFRAMRDLGKPIVARVNGDALGGGLGLVAACDLVVSRDDARFGTPEIKLGLFPWIILASILRVVPRKVALELALTGDPISADEARRVGLVNRVVPLAALDVEVDRLCASVERHSPALLALGRDGISAMSEMTLDQALAYGNAMLTVNTLAEDAAEGVAAFLGKRAPEWKGR